MAGEISLLALSELHKDDTRAILPVWAHALSLEHIAAYKTTHPDFEGVDDEALALYNEDKKIDRFVSKNRIHKR